MLQNHYNDSGERGAINAGAVFGPLGSMYAGFLPIDMAVFGPMADMVPLQWIMIGSGVALMLMAIIYGRNRHFEGKSVEDI